MEQILEIIKWWFVLELIGILVLPLSGTLFSNLNDKGVSVSKIMGLLLFTYFSWILVSFGVGYGYTVLSISLFLMLILSIVCISKNGFNIKLKYILESEIIFTIAYIVFVVIRSYSPDNYFIVGEKFMDVAFIEAILRSTTFPPFDPWFAGETLNYYYFGYLIITNLMKLTSSITAVGFNIASAAFYAISFTAAFGIGYNLTSKFKGGIITAFFVTIIGNLVGFIQLVVIVLIPKYYDSYYVQGTDLVGRLSHFSLWPSEIIIPNIPVQFPFFSFLLGDLHPNFIAISFQLLTITILFSLHKMEKITKLHLVILGLAVGFFYPLNTWNYPVYLFLSLVLLLRKNTLIKKIKQIIFVVFISFIAYLPYHLTFNNLHTISIVIGERTELVHYLLIFGIFLLLITILLVSESKTYLTLKKLNLNKLLISIILLTYLLVIFIFKFQLLILMIPLVVSLFYLVKEKDTTKQIIFILIITGIALTLFGEIFFIVDTLNSSPYFRVNTVYKLYDQIWIFYAITAAYIFSNLIKSNKKLAIIACLFIAMSIVFPILGTYSKSIELKDGSTLDGESSIRQSYPYEYEAIEWFRKIDGTPVILEASGYTGAWNSYVSTFTGFPTVLGWEWHEYQWRMNLTEIETRRSDVELAYTSLDYNAIKNVIDKYNIKYIYIGPVEDDRYNLTPVFDQGPDHFKLVFENRDVKIYEIV